MYCILNNYYNRVVINMLVIGNSAYLSIYIVYLLNTCGLHVIFVDIDGC